MSDTTPGCGAVTDTGTARERERGGGGVETGTVMERESVCVWGGGGRDRGQIQGQPERGDLEIEGLLWTLAVLDG